MVLFNNETLETFNKKMTAFYAQENEFIVLLPV